MNISKQYINKNYFKNELKKYAYIQLYSSDIQLRQNSK